MVGFFKCEDGGEEVSTRMRAYEAEGYDMLGKTLLGGGAVNTDAASNNEEGCWVREEYSDEVVSVVVLFCDLQSSSSRSATEVNGEEQSGVGAGVGRKEKLEGKMDNAEGTESGNADRG